MLGKLHLVARQLNKTKQNEKKKVTTFRKTHSRAPTTSIVTEGII